MVGGNLFFGQDVSLDMLVRRYAYKKKNMYKVGKFK